MSDGRDATSANKGGRSLSTEQLDHIVGGATAAFRRQPLEHDLSSPMNTIVDNHPAVAAVESPYSQLTPEQQHAFEARLNMYGLTPDASAPHVQTQTGPAVHVINDLHELERLAGAPESSSNERPITHP
jgi:hypothetical protein